MTCCLLSNVACDFRGTYTQPHLSRISLARNLREAIVGHLDEELGVHKSRRSASELSRQDVLILVDRMKDGRLLQRLPGRRGHSHMLSFVTGNPMDELDGRKLLQWMGDRLDEARTKNCYKQYQ